MLSLQPAAFDDALQEADVARIEELIGAPFEVLDSWTEGRRTTDGKTPFRMYKVSNGEYYGISSQDDALYDQEGLALLASAAKEVASPIDKVSGPLREAANEWGDGRQVTVQLMMSPEAKQLAQGAWEDVRPADNVTEGSLGAFRIGSDVAAKPQAANSHELEEQLSARLAALGVQEQAHAGVIDALITRHEIAAEDVVYRYKYAPFVAATVSWEECLALAADPHVVAINHEKVYEGQNERSVAAAQTRSAWAGGYDGTGVVVATVEEGRMQTSSYLTATIRPGTYTARDHATAVGGIIRSTHSFFRGHAPGVTLLNAASSSWSYTDLIAATEWAVSQGAQVINHSWNETTPTYEFDSMDLYLDYLTANSHVLNVVAAGNAGNSVEYVGSPAKGYNVVSVGNIDGGTSALWTDDTMRPSSSFKNPESGGEKPEVAMYGSNIYTTRKDSPYIGNMDSGTSYAAPAVAAFAAMWIESAPFASYYPAVSKAAIMASAVSHNIEGDSRLSDKDGAGAAQGSVVFGDGLITGINPGMFDSNGEYEVPMDIPLQGGVTSRIVLAYHHLPHSSSPPTPGPEDYDKSDLDLRLYVGGSLVAVSSDSTRNAFEIIDHTPSSDQTGRVRVYNWNWDPDISGLVFGTIYGSTDSFGPVPDGVFDDIYEENDTFSTARPMSTGTFNDLRLTDQDWYSISVAASNAVTFTTSFDHDIGDLDLTLHDSSQLQIGSSVGTGDSESVSFTNTSSTTQNYYAQVYGHLDARNTYQMHVTIDKPDLLGYDTFVPSTINWGQTFTIDGQVYNNDGIAATATFTQDFFLSDDQTWGDADDVYLCSYTHAADVPAFSSGPDFSLSCTLPSPPPSGYAVTGPFYIGMKTDAYNNVSEIDETNNGPGDYSQGWDWDSFTPDTYDLRGFYTFIPSELSWGQTFTLDGRVHNAGTGAVTDTFYQLFYLSNDQIWGDSDDRNVGSYVHSADVAAWDLGPNFDVSLTLPATAPVGFGGSGPFYIGMMTDAYNHIVETDETNNGPGDFPVGHDWHSFTVVPAPDLEPPRVTGVKVGSSVGLTGDWSTAFLNFIDPAGVGYPIPHGQHQLDSLPWVSIRQLFVEFSEDVVDVDATDIQLLGVNVADYGPQFSSVAYDSIEHRATITLANPIGADRLQLIVKDTVTDLAGNRLDGDWADGSTTGDSGNGWAGGDFEFALNVLPGDVYQEGDEQGDVSIVDTFNARNRHFQQIGNPLYSVTYDVNGDGWTNIVDTHQVRQRHFTSLPPAGGSAAAVVDVDEVDLDGLSSSLWGGRTAWHEDRPIGDSNDDGLFNSSDLVQVSVVGKYEDGIPNNTTFHEGDWNGDSDFDSSDLVLAFQAGVYERPATGSEIAAAVDWLLAHDQRADFRPAYVA